MFSLSDKTWLKMLFIFGSFKEFFSCYVNMSISLIDPMTSNNRLEMMWQHLNLACSCTDSNITKAGLEAETP
jgi:hypothetical protein